MRPMWIRFIFNTKYEKQNKCSNSQLILFILSERRKGYQLYFSTIRNHKEASGEVSCPVKHLKISLTSIKTPKITGMFTTVKNMWCQSKGQGRLAPRFKLSMPERPKETILCLCSDMPTDRLSFGTHLQVSPFFKLLFLSFSMSLSCTEVINFVQLRLLLHSIIFLQGFRGD